MRAVPTALVLAIMLSACASAPRSRWQASEAVYMVCTCDGTERQPTPAEAAGIPEGERVDLYCEGKVHDCHAGSMGIPMQRFNAGFNPNQLD